MGHSNVRKGRRVGRRAGFIGLGCVPTDDFSRLVYSVDGREEKGEQDSNSPMSSSWNI